MDIDTMLEKIEADLSKYDFNGQNLYLIRNRNELRVLKIMPKVLEEYPDWSPDPLDIEDVFALTLNTLPPRYVQRGTIVLSEPVKAEAIEERLRQAIYTVRRNPKHGRPED